MKSGLLVKKTAMQEGPQGNMPVSTLFSDYKSFNGVQVPTKISLDVGIKIDIKFDDVKINSGLKAEDIK